MSSFCDTVDVVVVVVVVVVRRVVCVWSCLVPLVMRFSASEVCVSWGGASVGGCSACLPVPHSSSATSHSHRFRGEESTHRSPAHSEPVVHSPRRSESPAHTNAHIDQCIFRVFAANCSVNLRWRMQISFISWFGANKQNYTKCISVKSWQMLAFYSADRSRELNVCYVRNHSGRCFHVLHW